MTSCFERIHFWNHKTHFHAMKRFQRTKYHTHLTATLGRYPSSRRRLIHWRKSATIDTYRSLLSPMLYSPLITHSSSMALRDLPNASPPPSSSEPTTHREKQREEEDPPAHAGLRENRRRRQHYGEELPHSQQGSRMIRQASAAPTSPISSMR